MKESESQKVKISLRQTKVNEIVEDEEEEEACTTHAVVHAWYANSPVF